MEDRNGALNGVPSPGDHYDLKKENLANLDRETRNGLGDIHQHIAALQSERENCMKAAATHAGNLGMVYRADTNEYVRMRSGVPLPEMPEPPATLPDDDAAIGKALAAVDQVERDALEDLDKQAAANGFETPPENTKWYRAIPEWLIGAVVGVFIGYGLGKITGLPVDQQPVLLGVFLVLGAGVIIGLKLFLHKIWEEYARAKRREASSPGMLIFYTALTAIFCLAEASLGGYAIVTYSKRVAFRQEDAVPYWMALLIAIAISTPILLYSAFKGHGQGIRSLTLEDERLRVEALNAKRQRITDERLRTQREAAQRRAALVEENYRSDQQRRLEARNKAAQEHDAECARRREECDKEREQFEYYKTAPDFEALLGYIGRISALNIRIEEESKHLTSFKIGRGYERAFKGKDLAALPTQVEASVDEA
ncbi:MAG: hypothetical protein ACR2HJ_10565 [Fimbriimonadales bacterium]